MLNPNARKDTWFGKNKTIKTKKIDKINENPNKDDPRLLKLHQSLLIEYSTSLGIATLSKTNIHEVIKIPKIAKAI